MITLYHENHDRALVKPISYDGRYSGMCYSWWWLVTCTLCSVFHARKNIIMLFDLFHVHHTFMLFLFYFHMCVLRLRKDYKWGFKTYNTVYVSPLLFLVSRQSSRRWLEDVSVMLWNQCLQVEEIKNLTAMFTLW